MAKPVGLTSKLKNNDHKNARAHEEWMKGKRLGRPKQQFFQSLSVSGWQKVTA